MQIWLLQQFVMWIVPFVVTGPHNWSWTNKLSRYHTFFLVLCWLVVVCFYCCNNSSENIVDSLKILRQCFADIFEVDYNLKTSCFGLNLEYQLIPDSLLQMFRGKLPSSLWPRLFLPPQTHFDHYANHFCSQQVQLEY